MLLNKCCAGLYHRKLLREKNFSDSVRARDDVNEVGIFKQEIEI